MAAMAGSSASTAESRQAGASHSKGSGPGRSHVALGGDLRPSDQLTGLDLSELRELVQRKLAWYGLRSVKIGPFRRFADRSFMVDLLDRQGRVIYRLKVDRKSGAIRPASGEPTLAVASAVSAPRPANPGDATDGRASKPGKPYARDDIRIGGVWLS